MASEQAVADEIVEAMSGAGDVRSRKMFGEYAVYLGDRVVAFVCDNQLFVKITPGSKEVIKEDVQGEAYPGSKRYYVVSADYWDDRDYMETLAQAVARDVKPPKKRR
jgi:DNA transformation protein